MKNFGNKLSKILKTNLAGTFSWKKYTDQGYHDHKFGPNKFDYIAQLPVIGLVFSAFIYSLIIIIGFPIKCYLNFTGQRK